MPLGVNDVVHIVYKGTLFSQQVMTNLTYRVSATTSTDTIAGDQLSIATEFSNALNDLVIKLRALTTADYTLNDVSCQRILPVRMTITEVNTGGLAGQRAGTCDTANIAAVFTRKTTFAGRKQRSTLHMYGMSNSDIAAGVLSAGYQTDLISFASETKDTQIVTNGVAQTITLVPVIVHRPLGPTNFDDIVDFDINTLARTMRRRTVGLGI